MAESLVAMISFMNRRFGAARAAQERAEWVQRFSREAEELFNMSDPARVAHRDSRLHENQKKYPGGFPEGQQKIYGYDVDAALAGVPA